MPVTDINAIRFCNQRVRVNADKLAQAYNLGVAAIDRWNVLGGGQTAVDIMGPDIKKICDRFEDVYHMSFLTEKMWFAWASALIPNDNNQIFDNQDNTAQDPLRPPMTGAIVNNLITRTIQFQNWLLSATGSFTDSARGSVDWYNTILHASNNGVAVLTVANAGNAITRFSELKTRYQASSNAELNTILAVAVNPNL